MSLNEQALQCYRWVMRHGVQARGWIEGGADRVSGWFAERVYVPRAPSLEVEIHDLLLLHESLRHVERPRNAWGISLDISARGRMLVAMTGSFFPPTNNDHPDDGWPQPSDEEWAALEQLRKDGAADCHCDGGGHCEWQLTKRAGKYYRREMFEDMARMQRERRRDAA